MTLVKMPSGRSSSSKTRRYRMLDAAESMMSGAEYDVASDDVLELALIVGLLGLRR